MSDVKKTDTKKRLSKSDILAAKDVRTIEVYVPEWDGSVFIRSMTAREAMRFAEDKGGHRDSAVRLLAICAVDENGKSLFTEEDVEALREKSLKAISLVQDAAMELNGFNKKAAAAKND